MKTRFVITVFFLLSVAMAFGQQDGQVFSGRVVDAETKEPLPYVNVRTKGAATLANADGDFSLTASPTDTVSFYCVGYQTLRLRPSDASQTIRLRPLSMEMNELVVRAVPVDDVLKKLIKKIQREHKRGEKNRRTYFYRASVTDDVGCEMLEAFIDAKSAINIRNMYLISGITRDGFRGVGSEIGLAQTNIHRLLELGPCTWDSELWKYALCPLEDFWTTKYCYDCSATILKGDEGHDIYKLSLAVKDSLYGTPAEWHLRRGGKLVEGTFYVDASSLNLLRMDANVKNAYQRVRSKGDQTVEQVKLEIHAEYQRRGKVDEVASISMTNVGEHMKFSSFLFDVNDMENIPGKGDRKRNAVSIGSNLMSAMEQTTFDAPYWEMYDIVKRTADEERALFGSTLVEEQQRENAFAADTVGTENAALREIWQRLWASSWRRSQEKVYVHLDNTSYRLGDNIWFAAYVHDTHDKMPSQRSGLLYVELLDPNGNLVERKNVELRNGRGFGNFVLDKQIAYAGFYELRAYTRWQLGFGVHEREHPAELDTLFVSKEKEHEFFRDYDKLYSRVFPVYDSNPDENGDWRTITPKPLITRAKKPKERQLQVSLFPEGGHLIVGMQSEVAFEAAWDDGEWAEGELQWGDIPVKTTNRGRGRFYVVPMTEESRELTFVPSEGKPVKLMLPESEQSGVALHAAEEPEGWRIDISCTSDLSPRHLGLTIMNEGKLCYFRPLTSHRSTFLIPSETLPQGVCQATVFDDNGRVFADRLFFSWREGLEKPSLSIDGLKQEYAPFERIRLKVRRAAPVDSTESLSSVVSVSVRDASLLDSTFDNASILAEMLLSSEIRGFVPDPAWFFRHDDEEHRNALDLLLLTQGWRRFEWREMNTDGFGAEKPIAERIPILTGKVLNMPPQTEAEKQGEARWILHTEAVNLENMKRSHMYDALPPDGHFTLSLPRTQGGFAIFMNMMEKKRGKAIKEQKDIESEDLTKHLGKPLNKKEAKKLEKEERKKAMAEALKMMSGVPNFNITLNLPYPRFPKPYSYYQTRLMSGSIQQRKPQFAGLKDKYPTLVMGDLEAENKRLDAGLRLGKLKAITLFSTGNFDAGHTLRYGINRFRRNYMSMHLVPEDSTYAPKYLKSFPLSVVSSRLFNPDEVAEYQGVGAIVNYVVYTDASLRESMGATADTTVFIAEYPYRDGNKRWMNVARAFQMQSFDPPAFFYNPDYSRIPLPEGGTDYRRTLYWNPALELNESGEAYINFYNNSCKNLSVEAQGQAPDGTFLWTQ